VRLHLVDGTYELFRAHYSKRPDHRAPAGWDAKATVGVVSSLMALLADPSEAVTHVAVAFDNPIRSFRNDLFKDYKSDEGVPPELRAQFDAVEEAVRAMGVVVWSMRDHEADDALATGAFRFADQVDQVRILTPDKDLGQCLRGDRVVQVDRRQLKVTDDGIPGLAGFGERSASMLLGVYENLELIPEHPYKWKVRPRGALRLAATLRDQRENALLYRKLATLVETVPLSESLDDLRFRGVPRARYEAWCDALGVRALRTVPTRWV
jgi:5'-3' exonuclease